MKVHVNGEPREVPETCTVAALLDQLGRHPRTVAVELNGDILPRAEYPERALEGGDRLEIVGFVQGG